jgi:hypothetical protein
VGSAACAAHVGEEPPHASPDSLAGRIASQTQDGRLRQRRLRADRVGERSLHIPDRRPADEPRRSPAPPTHGLIIKVPNSWEANCLVAPRSLGRASITGPRVVFTMVGQQPLRILWP